MDSKSSLRDYSIPLCVLTLQYLAVPTNPLPSINGICFPLLVLKYLANPKSIRWRFFPVFPNPITKFSGLISRCMIFLPCKVSILVMLYSANIKTVLTENLYLQALNNFSKFGPRRFRTIALYSSSLKRKCNLGNPGSSARSDSILASRDNVDEFLANLDSNLIATNSLLGLCNARYI